MRALTRVLLALVLGGVAPAAAAILDPFVHEPVAATDDARALWRNPAAIGLRLPAEWRFGWARATAGEDALWALGVRGGVGGGFVRVRGAERRITAGAALGDDGLRLGWAVHARGGDGDGAPLRGDHTLGLLVRPEPWLSVGATTAHLFEPRRGPAREPRTHTLGVGWRPLALDRARAHTLGPRLTLTADLVAREQPLRRVGHRLGVELEALPGVALRAGWDDAERLRLGVALRGVRASVHGVQHRRSAGRRAADSGELSLHPRAEERTVLVLRGERRVAVLRLGGRLVDEPDPGPALLGGSGGAAAPPLHRALARALEDPLTQGVLLELQGVSGMAQLEELRPRLTRLRAAGKPVVAWLPYGAGRGDLLLASAADRVVASDEALFGALGLRVERRAYRALLERLGIRIERASHGAYKGAYREYSTDSVTAADREVIESLLDQQQAMFVTTVAAGRGLTPERLLPVLDGREWPAADMVRAGVLDTLGERADALAVLGRLSGLGDAPRTWSPVRLGAARAGWHEPARVAVVVAGGGMVTGRSGRDLLEGAVMGDQTVVAQLERAFRDRRVRAVVLRVDSPGGSGAAAHLIDRAVQRLRRETGKPLVVSMASAAASAAYHMSVHADWIVANRHTRTGSIGVYWLKPALEGLYERLGVRQQEFDRGDAMRGWSYARRWTPAEQAGADSSIRRMHDRFVATVAHGRRLGVAEVDAVAQGRVWLGDDALRHGLVDQVGGLEEAVAEARRRAGIPPGERIALRMYGRPRPGLVERLLADALQSRLGGDLRFSALTGPQARADLGALGED